VLPADRVSGAMLLRRTTKIANAMMATPLSTPRASD
jgi:hypothetical protein